MAISITRYVAITSGLAGQNAFQARALLARYFSNNSLIPPKTLLQFTTAAEVLSYFGPQSEEYLRAAFYFSFVSKAPFSSPQAIQFYRFVQSAIAPSIVPIMNNNSLIASWTSITSGSFILQMGGSTETISGLNFSGASTLADVADIVVDAIRDAGSFDLTGTTNTTTTVMLANTTGILPGMSVLAADITQGTTVVSVVPNTSILLSQAATGSNVGETITFNDPIWGLASVTYTASLNSQSYGGFFLTGGANDVATNPLVVVAGGGGTDITAKGLLGWLPEMTVVNGSIIPGAIWSSGSAAVSVTQTLIDSANLSNNFGSFGFLTNLNLSLQNVYDAAFWNLGENVKYMYSAPVTPANAVTWTAQSSPGLGAVGGVGLTLSPAITLALQGTVTSASFVITAMSTVSGLSVGMPITGTNIPSGTVIQSINDIDVTVTMSKAATGTITGSITFTKLEFPEMLPMMIEVTTDYTAVNSVQNYEFQQVAGLTPSVLNDADADAYDALAINYYGQTQQAGNQISFYQQGFLQGASVITNIVDMSPYVNEIWLKDALTVALMNALLALREIAANKRGIGIVLNTMQPVINLAVDNGTISVSKPLNNTQIQVITDITNDPLAWHQVQNSGYWVNVVLTVAGSVFTATYVLIYSKNDVIRKIIGSDTLI